MTADAEAKPRKVHGKFRNIGLDVRNSSLKVIMAIQEHGRIPKSERGFMKLFGNDKEMMRVVKDPEKMKQLLYIIQETTDEFVNRAESLMNDPNRSVQEKAQMALDIANTILLVEKEVRVAELKQVSEMIGNRGMGLDFSV